MLQCASSSDPNLAGLASVNPLRERGYETHRTGIGGELTTVVLFVRARVEEVGQARPGLSVETSDVGPEPVNDNGTLYGIN